jgi:SAM-dependent methyltransferase
MSRPGPDHPGFSDHWRPYHEAVDPRPYNPFLDVLEAFLPEPGLALDVGCGRGKTTMWLLERGFDVWAQDADQEAVSELLARFTNLREPHPSIQTAVVPFENADFPRCVLAVSVFSLFFTHPDRFDEVWSRLRAALAPGGVFGGQFLGVRDDWNGTGTTVHSGAEVERSLEGLDILHFEEVERDGHTVVGAPKHWHVFHVVVKNPD